MSTSWSDDKQVTQRFKLSQLAKDIITAFISEITSSKSSSLVDFFLQYDAYEGRQFAAWELATMLRFSTNKKSHFKEKDILVLFKNMKLKTDMIPIDTFLGVIQAEWPAEVPSLDRGKLGKRSRFEIFKRDAEFNEIADAFIDRITNGKRDKPSLLKFWSSVVTSSENLSLNYEDLSYFINDDSLPQDKINYLFSFIDIDGNRWINQIEFVHGFETLIQLLTKD